ncbi:hypothetical protein FNW25_08900 [Flavobacterium franklandianum]|uniref:hypothetical protein n=1 Tax=Flavobacterium franklandianum TaxID=2594430 RepID=UPI00117B8FAB|nr:hypothetical protein [Flavobacterium franklandianum]TRX25541.1 hypothetical protein FNW25_08900 [Flavobacterium franklandianum]
MNDTLIIGLTLAFISGISVFAFKHKKAFEKIVWKFIGLLFFIYLILSLWSSAVAISFNKLSKYIHKNSLETEKNELPQLPIDQNVITIIFFSFYIYLFALSYLIRVVNNTQE